MELHFVELIGEAKSGEKIFRTKTSCSCCKKEIVVAMPDDMFDKCQEYDTDIFCADCAIKEKQITKKQLKKTVSKNFYCIVNYLPDKSYKGDKPYSYQDYLKTEHWKKVRQEAVNRAGNRCQLCNKPGTLNVHHRTYENIGNELPGDLIALCGGCHANFITS